jgi:hypothetical protein
VDLRYYFQWRNHAPTTSRELLAGAIPAAALAAKAGATFEPTFA